MLEEFHDRIDGETRWRSWLANGEYDGFAITSRHASSSHDASALYVCSCRLPSNPNHQATPTSRTFHPVRPAIPQAPSIFLLAAFNFASAPYHWLATKTRPASITSASTATTANLSQRGTRSSAPLIGASFCAAGGAPPEAEKDRALTAVRDVLRECVFGACALPVRAFCCCGCEDLRTCNDGDESVGGDESESGA